MRHFLKFIPVDKRAQAESEYAATNPGVTAAPSAERPSVRVATRQAAMPPPPSAKREGRAAGPEFGGLVEGRNARGGSHVPDFVEGLEDRHSRAVAGPPVRDVRVEAKGIKAKLEASAATDNTSAYLAALDNSALTLADSGIFKQDEPEPAPERSFNPYNRG